MYISQKVNCKAWGWNCKPSSPSEELPIPIVWVHDYHLMLAANTIRDICKEEGLEIRMGFFLHIPFPSFDIIRIFPWVDEILMGMLGKNEKWYYTSKIDFWNRVLTFSCLFHITFFFQYIWITIPNFTSECRSVWQDWKLEWVSFFT